MEAITKAAKAYEELLALTTFAYEQGFHELGYDPLEEVFDLLDSYRTLIVNLENEIARLKAGKP